MGQDAVEAQQYLAALMAGLQPLIPLVSPATCQAVTDALVAALEEALNVQEAAAKKEGELKQLTPKDLLLARVRPAKASEAGEAAKKKGDASDEGRSKRARKPVVVDDDNEESAAPPKKKQSKKKVAQPPKHAKQSKDAAKEAVAWSAEYARITDVTGVTGGGANVRVDVMAKNAGRGYWKPSAFFLDVQGLGAIDALPADTLSTFVKSFRKAANASYGGNWPKELVAALRNTVWARDMLSSLEDWGLPDLGVEAGNLETFNFNES